MQIPVQRWHEAIPIRHSRRTYTHQLIPADYLKQLTSACQNFRPFGDTAYGVVVTTPPDDVFRGLLGSYGKVTGAQAYIAFIGNTDDRFVEEKVGYVGEGLILEATALGIHTCWVGGFFKRELVGQHISLRKQEKVFAITPIGYSPDHYSLTEKVLVSIAKSKRRKAGSVLCSGLPSSQWKAWQRVALENARIAPSAVNRQPWRFEVRESEILLSVDTEKEGLKDVTRRLDCGIALLHLDVGARSGGVVPGIEFLSSPQVARLFDTQEREKLPGNHD